jgi:hypothetical protein
MQQHRGGTHLLCLSFTNSFKALAALLLSIVFAGGGRAHAQRTHTSNFTSWWVYNGDHKLNTRLGVHAEVQWRRNNFISDPQQLLLRTGLNYAFGPAVFISLGYCFVETHPYGAFAVKTRFPEHRIWQQVQIKNSIGRAELVTRFRQEQRLVKSPIVDTTTGVYTLGNAVYTNRSRIFTRVSLALNRKSISDGCYYFTAYNELFVNYGKYVQGNLLDQNRIFLGIGFKAPHLGRIELGFLEQSLVKSDNLSIEDNHTLVLSWNAGFDFFSH